MRGLYYGWHARHYDQIWRTFTARSLDGLRALIDWPALSTVPARLGRSPRALDAGCGTGILLAQLLAHVPDLEATGVDASTAMLVQTRATLAAWPAVRLDHAQLRAGPRAGLPYAPATFDLITCANLLHYLAEPAVVLAGLAQLLVPGGQLVIEDFARRAPPFPWTAFEWVVRRVDPRHVRAYTLDEALGLCALAHLPVADARAFAATRLWHAWSLRVAPVTDSPGEQHAN